VAITPVVTGDFCANLVLHGIDFSSIIHFAENPFRRKPQRYYCSKENCVENSNFNSRQNLIEEIFDQMTFDEKEKSVQLLIFSTIVLC